jgi:hypothetical protein
MDKTTKLLLAAIALGLWANAWASLLRPAQAQRGDTYDLGTIAASLNGITRALQGLDEQASNIGRGICQNRKLC